MAEPVTVYRHRIKLGWRLRLRLTWHRVKRPVQDWRSARRCGMSRQEFRALLDAHQRDVERAMLFGTPKGEGDG